MRTLDSGAREESAAVRRVLARVEELRFAGLVEAVVADGAKELSFADNFLHGAEIRMLQPGWADRQG